jgi:hypothetical protein
MKTDNRAMRIETTIAQIGMTDPIDSVPVADSAPPPPAVSVPIQRTTTATSTPTRTAVEMRMRQRKSELPGMRLLRQASGTFPDPLATPWRNIMIARLRSQLSSVRTTPKTSKPPMSSDQKSRRFAKYQSIAGP